MLKLNVRTTFIDIYNEGLDGVFGEAGATKIIHLPEGIELLAAA